MVDRNRNMVMGIAAGVISVLAIIILIKTLTVKPMPVIKGDIPQTPASTPYVK
mgnify:CR=1 FL=1